MPEFTLMEWLHYVRGAWETLILAVLSLLACAAIGGVTAYQGRPLPRWSLVALAPVALLPAAHAFWGTYLVKVSLREGGPALAGISVGLTTAAIGWAWVALPLALGAALLAAGAAAGAREQRDLRSEEQERLYLAVALGALGALLLHGALVLGLEPGLLVSLALGLAVAVCVWNGTRQSATAAACLPLAVLALGWSAEGLRAFDDYASLAMAGRSGIILPPGGNWLRFVAVALAGLAAGVAGWAPGRPRAMLPLLWCLVGLPLLVSPSIWPTLEFITTPMDGTAREKRP